MTDLHMLGYNTSFVYKDSHNYYDIDVDKTLLLKKSDNEYFVRYNDVNKNKIIPSQLKINNFSFSKLDIFAYDYVDATADVDMEAMIIFFFLINVEKYGIKLLN